MSYELHSAYLECKIRRRRLVADATALLWNASAHLRLKDSIHEEYKAKHTRNVLSCPTQPPDAMDGSDGSSTVHCLLEVKSMPPSRLLHRANSWGGEVGALAVADVGHDSEAVGRSAKVCPTTGY